MSHTFPLFPCNLYFLILPDLSWPYLFYLIWGCFSSFNGCFIFIKMVLDNCGSFSSSVHLLPYMIDFIGCFSWMYHQSSHFLRLTGILFTVSCGHTFLYDIAGYIPSPIFIKQTCFDPLKLDLLANWTRYYRIPSPWQKCYG